MHRHHLWQITDQPDKVANPCRGQLFFSFSFISLIADGPHITVLPVVTKDLPISPRFTPYIFFIAMQVQHSYNSSTIGRRAAQLKSKKYPVPRSRLRIWSREAGSVVPSRVSLLILNTQVESGACSRDSYRFPRRSPFINTAVRVTSDAFSGITTDQL